MGDLKSALYARMEEVSFRSAAAVVGAVLAAAGVAITLAVVLGGHSDAAASAPSSRAAIPSVAPPSPHHVSATPQASPPKPAPSSSHTSPWQPRPPKWTPGDPRRPSPPDWGWPG